MAGNNSSNLCVTTVNEANVELDGYSLPVYGLADGTFYNLHIPALTCICLSFMCATASIVYSFYHQHYSTFLTGQKVKDLLFTRRCVMPYLTLHILATIYIL